MAAESKNLSTYITNAQYRHDDNAVAEYVNSIEQLITMLRQLINYNIPAITADVETLREKFPERTILKSYHVAANDQVKALPTGVDMCLKRIHNSYKKMYNFSK